MPFTHYATTSDVALAFQIALHAEKFVVLREQPVSDRLREDSEFTENPVAYSRSESALRENLIYPILQRAGSRREIRAGQSEHALPERIVAVDRTWLPSKERVIFASGPSSPINTPFSTSFSAAYPGRCGELVCGRAALTLLR